MRVWKPWFAWYPVELQYPNKTVWMRWVEYEEVYAGVDHLWNRATTVSHYRLPDSAPEFRMPK